MPTYTPKQLLPTAFVSATAANIYKPVALTGIIRTMVINASAASKTITLGMNTTDNADVASKRFLELYALAQSVPFIFNGWLVADTTTWLTGLTTTASTVTISLSGYEYV